MFEVIEGLEESDKLSELNEFPKQKFKKILNRESLSKLILEYQCVVPTNEQKTNVLGKLKDKYEAFIPPGIPTLKLVESFLLDELTSANLKNYEVERLELLGSAG